MVSELWQKWKPPRGLWSKFKPWGEVRALVLRSCFDFVGPLAPRWPKMVCWSSRLVLDRLEKIPFIQKFLCRTLISSKKIIKIQKSRALGKNVNETAIIMWTLLMMMMWIIILIGVHPGRDDACGTRVTLENIGM